MNIQLLRTIDKLERRVIELERSLKHQAEAIKYVTESVGAIDRRTRATRKKPSGIANDSHLD